MQICFKPTFIKFNHLTLDQFTPMQFLIYWPFYMHFGQYLLRLWNIFTSSIQIPSTNSKIFNSHPGSGTSRSYQRFPAPDIDDSTVNTQQTINRIYSKLSSHVKMPPTHQSTRSALICPTPEPATIEKIEEAVDNLLKTNEECYK